VIQTRGLRYRYPGAPVGGTLAFPDLDLPSGSTLLLCEPLWLVLSVVW
jgi:hypothetical protein